MGIAANSKPSKREHSENTEDDWRKAVGIRSAYHTRPVVQPSCNNRFYSMINRLSFGSYNLQSRDRMHNIADFHNVCL